jgi:hypothetical protein
MEATRSVRPERLTLPQAIRTREKRIRPAIRTVEEAIRLIDTELPQELQVLRRWTLLAPCWSKRNVQESDETSPQQSGS